MSEFFLELFSEEIPANLQKSAREIILKNFKDFFEKENIHFAKCSSFSTPNRLGILFEEVDKEIREMKNIKRTHIIKTSKRTYNKQHGNTQTTKINHSADRQPAKLVTFATFRREI